MLILAFAMKIYFEEGSSDGQVSYIHAELQLVDLLCVTRNE